jgi:two-component system cell cycle sensor histidine kinase/response regulator CckA
VAEGEADAPDAAEGLDERGGPARATGTVLLVEDDDEIRPLLQRLLDERGYDVLVAPNAAEALRVAEWMDRPIDLLLTDIVMPGMNGRELAARLQALRPGVRVLYTSGYTEDAILRHGVLDDASRFLSKPYTPAELRRRIREALD